MINRSRFQLTTAGVVVFFLAAAICLSVLAEAAEFTSGDHEQLKTRGIPLDVAKLQLRLLRAGEAFQHLQRPCTVGNGIVSLGNADIGRLRKLYRDAADQGRAQKFQIASGAASRMFKELHVAKNEFPATAHSSKMKDKPRRFFAEIKKFAFFDALNAVAHEKTKMGVEQLIGEGQHRRVLELLLDKEGLNYGTLPKGSILFHRYADGHVASAFEEHVIEGQYLVADRDGNARIHFTVPPGQEEHVRSHVTAVSEKLGLDASKLKLSYSEQGPDTDAVAIDRQTGMVFRNADGSLFFRASGHGALLPNLNALKGDIVFLKNIDNVVPRSQLETTLRYKEALGGLLVEKQTRAHELIRKLDESPTRELVNMGAELLSLELGASFVSKKVSEMGVHEGASLVRELLDRPFRVCGMVKNEGEPGGGPFFVEDSQGRVTTRIIESHQVDLNNKSQTKMWNDSTHFNPVDFVMGVRDHEGRPYDLAKYSDPQEAFISPKSQDGRALWAIETGLWHGQMANWNTLFVEVPLETFNPVKEVFDLLRPAHQITE